MAHHHHDHSPQSFGRAFAIGIALNLGFVVLEFVFGTLSHSLALMSDGVHNFSDVFALLIAWGASLLMRRHATARRTYGWRRSSILAALLNATILLLVTGGLAAESVRRLTNPGEVNGGTVIAIAAIGIVVNGVTALLFVSGRKDDLNIREAFLHMAADAGISAGVVVSGIIIAVTGWWILDPLVSLIIGAVVLISTWSLLRDSVNLALDAVPEGIDTMKVQDYLTRLPNVVSVHDLHIWGMSTTEAALTAHLVMRRVAGNDGLLARAADDLHDNFGIEHVTLQQEPDDPAYQCRHCEALSASVRVGAGA